MLYFIWTKSHGGAFYRPGSRGYTENPDIAGKFPKEEADSIEFASHCNCVGYPENSPFITKKRNEYLQKKSADIRCCLETMTPRQVLEIMPDLVQERIDLFMKGGI